jgi:hypothetical protein
MSILKNIHVNFYFEESVYFEEKVSTKIFTLENENARFWTIFGRRTY